MPAIHRFGRPGTALVMVLGEPLAETATAGAILVVAGIWLAQGGRLPTLARAAAPLRPAVQST
jgi:hypothetical protein